MATYTSHYPIAYSTTTVKVTTTFGAQNGYESCDPAKVTVRAQSGELLDGYPAIYSGVGGVNPNPAYTYIRVKQTTETGWNAIEGRLTWTYLDA